MFLHAQVRGQKLFVRPRTKDALNVLHIARGVFVIIVPLINNGQHPIINHINISLHYVPVIL